MNFIFFKKIVISVLYFMTALTACFFSLLLVLNFLNPALSQDNSVAQKKEQQGLKEIMGDIVKNLKTIFKGISPDKDSDTKETAEEGLDQPGVPPEGAGQPEVPPAFDQPGVPPEGAGQPEPQPAFDQPGVPPEGAGQPEPQPAFDQPGVPPEGAGQPESPSAFDLQKQLTESLSDLPSDLAIEIQSKIAPFIYEYGQRKDPFEDPTIQDEISAEGEGVVIIPKTPPEEYNLSEISLKGVIWHTETPKALFELPSNAGYYTLIKGDKIGKNGVIFEIREDEVVVVETSFIGRGQNKKEEIKVKIKKMDRLNLFKGVTF